MNELKYNDDLELKIIENRILKFKNAAAQNLIQLGNELNKAKEKVPHGEWGTWLRKRVQFSQRTANIYMRIAKEFGSNSQAVSNLKITKLALLLDVPEEKRTSFIEEHNVREMSTRELKAKNAVSGTFSSRKIETTAYLALLKEINDAAERAKDTMVQLDKVVTDLSVATGDSRSSVKDLLKDYNSMAKQLASTTTQVGQAADDYLRAGKSMKESNQLIKDSIMLSKLGQINSSEATEDLLATMNGFDMAYRKVSYS